MSSPSIDAKPLIIIREAFISLLPVVLVMNILVMLSGLTGVLESINASSLFIDKAALSSTEINRLYFFLLPLFVNLSLSTLLAKHKGLDQIGTLLIAMVCFLRGSGFLGIDESAQIISYHGSILTSIPCAWLAVWLLHYFSKKPWLQIVNYRSDLSPRLISSLNLVIPGFLTVLLFELMRWPTALLLGADGSFLLAHAFPQFEQIKPIQELVVFKIIALCAWFVGLHGDHSASGIFQLLYKIPVGETTTIRMKPFYDVFLSIGGTGATFVVPFLILFTKQATRLKSIARLSLPFSFFNVNEILLFGLPILLNPIFFIPFFATAFVNMAIAFTAIRLGLFSIDLLPVHWMTPPLYSAYVATDGSLWAVATQMVCIVVDGCLYFPFLAIASQQYEAPRYLRRLFGGDAYGFVSEEMSNRQERLFVARQKDMLKSVAAAQKVLHQLRDGDFLLYFQPKMDARSLHLVGLEALLRFQDNDGTIFPPSFLPVLYKQGLSKAVDKKVVNLTFSQIARWRTMGFEIPPIAINFDKDFLLDSRAVQDFIARAKQHNIRFYIEITEHTYTVELKALASVIHQLRAAGHRIAIDDFGAGYSSLTNLVALEADEIKLDRQLVTAPKGEARRGQVLLASSIQLCHDLGFSVVAEGVETAEQLHLVQRCGVDVVQGYYLGKPMNASHISQLFCEASSAQTMTK